MLIRPHGHTVPREDVSLEGVCALVLFVLWLSYIVVYLGVFLPIFKKLLIFNCDAVSADWTTVPRKDVLWEGVCVLMLFMLWFSYIVVYIRVFYLF